MVLNLVPMANSGGGGGGLAILLPLVLIVGLIWFMSRTQRKQRQRQASTVARLRPGTRVITTGGQVGTVDEVEDEYVVLEIAPGVYSRFVKQAIGRVLDEPEDALVDDSEDVDDELDDLDDLDEEYAEDDIDEVEEPRVRDDVRDDVPDGVRNDRTDGRPLPPTHTEK